MSISSYTVVTMLDSRPSPITIPLPITTDILNRIITFKDLYGSASTNTITLVTRSGDTFEDGTFSTIMSNTYQTLNFYAGQPGKWLNIDGGSGGGSSAGLTTVSNLLNSVSTNVTSISTNVATVSNSVVTNMGYLTTVSNTVVTNTANITTVSNSGVTNATNLTTVSNSGVTNATNIGTVTTNLTTVSNAGVTNATNIGTVTTNLTTVSNSGVTNATNIGTVSNSGVTNATNIGTVTTNLTTVSNAGVTNATNIGTVTTNLTTVSNSGVTNATNIGTVSNSVVTNMGYLTTVSNTVAAGRFTGISTNTISTSLIIAGYVSSPQGYISSLIVDALSFSLSNSFISMGDIITTSVSTIQTFTSTLTTNNLRVGTVSSLNFIAFSGLQQGYNQTVIAEQSTGTGIQELLFFKGSTTTDRIRIQTTGPIVFEPGVSARVFPATGSNATPAMIITTGSNVGIGVAAPTVSLDVAGAGRFTAVSTNTISTNVIRTTALSTNTISTNTISTTTMSANQYYGNGSLLTGITSGFISTATSDLNMNGNYLKDLTGHVDISGASINMHTSSIQQYLNYVPVAQPVIQFGSWSAGAASSDGTGGPYTVPITNYDNTNYCIYITGKYTTISAAYTAVPVDGSNFDIYFVNGDQSGSNVFYWQTMGYYGANAGPIQGN